VSIAQRIKRVDCDQCFNVAPLLKDGTVGVHYCTRNGIRQKCEYVGRRYAFHMGAFKVIERGPDRVATLWHCECRCGEMKTGSDYESVEAWHNEHYRSVSPPDSPAGSAGVQLPVGDTTSDGDAA
jgi:hypothetical protein